MLKLQLLTQVQAAAAQPPSGGCVLKLGLALGGGLVVHPAAFGRLCVETRCDSVPERAKRPAAFGRLCVETR